MKDALELAWSGLVGKKKSGSGERKCWSHFVFLSARYSLGVAAKVYNSI